MAAHAATRPSSGPIKKPRFVADDNTYFEGRGGTDAVAGDELIGRVRRGEVTVLDVRPAEEYRARHVPQAVSIPIDELKARLKELPKNREVVAYCRGPYCVMAVEAVELLRQKGYTARRMELGIPDWRARGWRVATVRGGTGA
ncbi:MAG: rhodanese-like domain-containing protein [Deltaproteobacteria bacterium]|nr:rhodanese-like domain-containing protein [Deltaproteobacteria bacterium]